MYDDGSESMVVYVYTDGSCVNNGYANARAGIGIYFGENDPRNVSRSVVGKQTNNVAELTAVIEAYELLKEDIQKGGEFVIVTDSEYVIKCVTNYGLRCARNGWTKDIPNKALVKHAYTSFEPHKNVTFLHVVAHTNGTNPHQIGNAGADALAQRATMRQDAPKKTTTTRVNLNVPFVQKEEAKKMGARWDQRNKTWYTDSSKTELIEKFTASVSIRNYFEST